MTSRSRQVSRAAPAGPRATLSGSNASHPPVLLVFHQVGKRPALKQMERVAELTREHGRGQ
ncbi:hypothetical protein [Streptomyces sp. NPDC093984]|uniref:hypothetical protein n=1 Tax=Streptomyces sp. NPDC093984 TaxID=3366052 RepID=UPI003828DABD